MTNDGLINAIVSSDDPLEFAGRQSGENVRKISARNFQGLVGGISSLASLPHFIGAIFGMSAKEEMRWVHANPDIALVTDAQFFWDFASIEPPRGAMSAPMNAVDSEISVAGARIDSTFPEPTFIFAAFREACLETLKWRKIPSSHAAPHRANWLGLASPFEAVMRDRYYSAA